MSGATGGIAETRAQLLLRSSRHPLARVVAAGLHEARLGERTPLVLAVSGGADSMAMLCLVAAVRERTDPCLSSLAVVSVDHGLRAESRSEAEAAVALARRLGIECATIVRVDVEREGNLLDRARDARLDALRDAARAFRSRHVALAHHAEDRAESVLLALARGGGLDALTGLRAVREFDDGISLVRPLLRARRAALRGLLAELDVAWHEDPSNALHARGTLRADRSSAALIDRMASGIATAVDEAIGLAEWRDAIAAEAAPVGARSMPRATFDAMPAAVRPAALARLARSAGAELPRTVVEQCAGIGPDDRAPRSFDCGAGHRLSVDARSVTVD